MSPPTTQSLRIVVMGWVLREPLGGMAWHFLQYVLGLADLGHRVYYVEDSGDHPSCHQTWANRIDSDPKEGLKFARASFDLLGLNQRWAYYDAHTDKWLGPCAERILEVCQAADLLVNVAGWANPLRPWLHEIPVRAFLDTDPAFTQVLHLQSPPAQLHARRHTVFFSFGQNVGGNGCSIPNDGLPWRPTRQPIVLAAWPASPGRKDAKFTTVMSWDSYGAREYGGVRYGMKSDSFEPYVDLPRGIPIPLEVAVRRIPPEKIDQLREGGWDLAEPRRTSLDLASYRRYVQDSKGEFSVAKHGYVVSRSGWFSERSAAYMASGRPVLLQDTGFSDWLPTGRGILAFNNPAEAVTGIEDVNANYGAHCRAAREIAAEYFDSRKVLTHLIEQAMNSSSATFYPELPERA